MQDRNYFIFLGSEKLGISHDHWVPLEFHIRGSFTFGHWHLGGSFH